MKKIINGKSYNTEYDSEKIARYDVRMDGWAHTAYTIFRKKSTGEYFEFSKWSEWNDGWDINLISEKKAMDILDHNRKGEDYRFDAVMAPFPGCRKKGQYFWGTREDDPWFGKKAEERKEERKRQREEMRKKAVEKKGDWGEIQITGVSKEGMKFRNYGKTVLSDEKYGKVLCWKVNFRFVNNNFDAKDGDRWYRDKVYVVMEGGDKDSVKGVFNGVTSGIEKDFGKWDVFMKDGNLEFSKRNSDMFKELHKRMREYNMGVISGE